MIDFNTLIKAAIDEGMTKEDLADQFTDALNEAVDKKTEFLDNLNAKTELNDFDYDTAYAMITVCAADDNLEWNYDEVKSFYDGVKNYVESGIKAINDVKDGKSPLDILCDSLKEMDIDKVIEDFVKSL